MTNAEAWFSIALRPWKPEGLLGWTAQDGDLDSHTAPELCKWIQPSILNLYFPAKSPYMSLLQESLGMSPFMSLPHLGRALTCPSLTLEEPLHVSPSPGTALTCPFLTCKEPLHVPPSPEKSPYMSLPHHPLLLIF